MGDRYFENALSNFVFDIAALREFQLKEYTLQKNGTFKVTPPGFNTDIIMKKVKEENLFGDTLIKNTF